MRRFPIIALSVLGGWCAAAPAVPDAAALKDAALRLDRQVAVFYRNQNLPVPAVTDDATFMRRAFLVSISRIPTSEESLAFLEIDDPQKREQLVAYLLNSQGYSSQMANWAFDLLRLTDGRVDSIRRPATHPTVTGFAWRWRTTCRGMSSPTAWSRHRATSSRRCPPIPSEMAYKLQQSTGA